MLHVLLALCTHLIFILNKFSPTLTLSQNFKIKKKQDCWFDSKFIAHCKSFQRVFFLQIAFSYFFAIFLLRGYLKYLKILFIEIMTLSIQNCSLYIKYTSHLFCLLKCHNVFYFIWQCVLPMVYEYFHIY